MQFFHSYSQGRVQLEPVCFLSTTLLKQIAYRECFSSTTTSTPWWTLSDKLCHLLPVWITRPVFYFLTHDKNSATLRVACFLLCLFPLSFKERIFFWLFWIPGRPKAPLQGWGYNIWSLTPAILKWKQLWLQSSCIVTAKSRTFPSVLPYTILKQENLLLLQVFCGYFPVVWHFLMPSLIEDNMLQSDLIFHQPAQEKHCK